MAASLPEDFRLQPTLGTVQRDGRLEGGTPRVRIDLDPHVAPTVRALLAGEPLGGLSGPDREAVVRRLLALDLATPRPTGHRARALRVAAVVPAHDAAATLPAALAGLAGVEEVIVVDDGSRDDTADVATDHGARVLRRPTAGGPAAARNTGAAATDADIVVFVDADTEAEPGWIGRLVPHFDDPWVGGVAPRVLSIGGTSALARHEAGAGTLDLGDTPGLVRPEGRVTFVSTTALALRRDAFVEIGGFAEDLRFGEDLDLVWRLWAAGRPVVYDPAVHVAHRHRPSLRAHLVNQFRYATASGPLSARHQGLPRAGRADPLVSLGAAAFLLGARRSGAALALGGTTRTVRSFVEQQVPMGDAARLGSLATIDGARNVAAAVSRPWLPIALAIAAARPRSRPGVALAILGRWLLVARRRGAAEGMASSIAIRALEDLAHSVGVARGCVAARSLGPLLVAPPTGPSSADSVLGRELRLP